MAVKPHEVALSKQQSQLNILFKLRTSKDFNKEAFKSTIFHLWLCSHKVTIREVGQNLFLANFVKKENLREILDKSPWSFKKKLILMNALWWSQSTTRRESISDGKMPSQKFKYHRKRLLARACGPWRPLYLLLLLKEILRPCLQNRSFTRAIYCHYWTNPPSQIYYQMTRKVDHLFLARGSSCR